MSFYDEYYNWFVVIGVMFFMLLIGIIIIVIVSRLFPKQVNSIVQFNRNIENDILWYKMKIILINNLFFLMFILNV